MTDTDRDLLVAECRDLLIQLGPTNASQPQPSPMPGKQRVLDAVINDLQERAESGRIKYGTYLETHNGRDPLWDAYQEAVGLTMYLRQALLEKGEEAICFTDDLEPVWSNNQVLVIMVVTGVMMFVIGLLAG